ncbi:hypothetical protein EDD21DRAFT_369950 [Dissophora ornata]|nr:hypothetical protein BGZ58_004313 [Dissophora ornata]KAI8603136.1 hypothetical protein EDD21DRAFT_369950 [Dissophora ornata]
MTTVQSPISAPNPSHTFMDQKPPLMPRQSTNDVLSFTKIINDRLAPGQTVWDYFSPAPPTPVATSSSGTTSPALPLSPVSPTSSSFGFFGSKRQSVVIDTSKLPPLSPQQQSQCASPTQMAAGFEDLSIASPTNGVTPKAQKRKSFAQSLRSMLSLSQLISSSNNTSKAAKSTGPPHYNILVLGSDSAPLASTLYKMSSLLPSTNKISHYQEVSGFFVAYFRSNGSFSCSPKTSTELNDAERKRRSGSFGRCSGDIKDEVKSRRGLEDIDQAESGSEKANRRLSTLRRSSGESEATLLNSRLGHHSKDGSDSSSEEDDRSTLYQEPLADNASEVPEAPIKASANASLSVHAFSLDSTWPVPRTLAQTFWFPHAHGIIYIVDAARKNDPRGIDNLVNARQFLSSLVADPNFKRRDIPVVVFANKAGLDDETCFRVDEIADILGCEEWDDEGKIMLQASDMSSTKTPSAKTTTSTTRPWCVKSTRSDGEGEGLRESVEWLKSRMGEIWKS